MDFSSKSEDFEAVTCSVGHRASLAVSMVARHGYSLVYNLLGGVKAWKALGLPTSVSRATYEEARR